jgi:hypothetical protein
MVLRLRQLLRRSGAPKYRDRAVIALRSLKVRYGKIRNLFSIGVVDVEVFAVLSLHGAAITHAIADNAVTSREMGLCEHLRSRVTDDGVMRLMVTDSALCASGNHHRAPGPTFPQRPS